MKANTEPTKGEVFYELADSAVDYVDSKIKSVAEFSASAARCVSALFVIPYILPTSVRQIKEYKDEPLQTLSASQNARIGVGFGLGVVTYLGEFIGYAYAATDDHPELLAIPVATNILSGVYEVGRMQYNKARERLVRKRNGDISHFVE